MDGDPTDNNAKLFAQGYNGVLDPKFTDGTYTKVGEPAGTWDPPTAATTFEQQFTAHSNINAVDHAERRQRERRHLGAAEGQGPAEDVPDHRSGRLSVGPSEHPEGLPVRDGLQAVLPRGAGGGRARALPAGGRHAADSLVNSTTKDDKTGDDIKSVYTPPTGSPPTTWRTPSSRTAPSRRRTSAPANWRARAHSAGHQLAGLRRAAPPPWGAARAGASGKGRARERDQRLGSAPSPARHLEDLRARAGAHRRRPRHPRRRGDRAPRRQRRRASRCSSRASRASTAPTTARSSGRGRPVRIRSPRDAAALGIETVYQDLALCNNLDIVAEHVPGARAPERTSSSTRSRWRRPRRRRSRAWR